MGNLNTQDQPPPYVTRLYRATTLTTVTNTTTANSIIGSSASPTDSLIIPANMLQSGSTIRFTIRGLFSTAAVLPGNLTLVNKLNSTTLATGTAASLLVGASNQSFSAVLLATCYTTGTTGTLMVIGGVDYTTGLTTAANSIPLNNGLSTVTIDTTIPQTFTSTVQWATASASNSISSMIAALEMIN